MNIAVSADLDDSALPVLWEARNSGHLLHLLATSTVTCQPPFSMVTVAPTERWAAFSAAEVFIGPEVDVAVTFVKHGRRAVIIGRGPQATINMAVVPTWSELPKAFEFFEALDSTPKVQIEYPSSVPGFVPREEAPCQQEIVSRPGLMVFPRLRRMAGLLVSTLSD